MPSTSSQKKPNAPPPDFPCGPPPPVVGPGEGDGEGVGAGVGPPLASVMVMLTGAEDRFLPLLSVAIAISVCTPVARPLVAKSAT